MDIVVDTGKNPLCAMHSTGRETQRDPLQQLDAQKISCENAVTLLRSVVDRIGDQVLTRSDRRSGARVQISQNKGKLRVVADSLLLGDPSSESVTVGADVKGEPAVEYIGTRGYCQNSEATKHLATLLNKWRALGQ